MSSVESAAQSKQGLVVREPWTAYAAWATDTLGLRLSFDGQRYHLTETESDDSAAEISASDSRAARSWLRRSKPKPKDPAETTVIEADSPGDAFRVIADRLAALPEPPSACPRKQPTAVHEIAQPLLTAYDLDGGTVHVAGCRLEDRPIYRVTEATAATDGNAEVTHHYFDGRSDALSSAWIESVGANRVGPLPVEASKSEHRVEQTQIAAIRVAANAQGLAADSAIAVVWVKHVSGTLRFDFGDESLDAPFSGWASTLVAPAVRCPATGVETFALSTVVGGAICATDQIAVCSVTGHRRPLTDLIRCKESGQLAEQDAIGACSISGDPVLDDLLKACSKCGEKVSASAIAGDVCSACRKPQSVPSSDPRVKRIVASQTALARRRWTASETRSVLVLESASWFRRRVVVFDRESLEPKHAAEASRFSPIWRRVAIEEL